MKRVLVCGGWDFQNRERVFEILDQVRAKRGVACIIQCNRPTGAEKWAREWAEEHEVPCESYGADWFMWAQQAEEKAMQAAIALGKAEAVILFGNGTVTEKMKRLATAASLPVWEIVV